MYVLFVVSGIINGIGASLIWIGIGSYITEVSANDETKSKNFGTFWMIFMNS